MKKTKVKTFWGPGAQERAEKWVLSPKNKEYPTKSVLPSERIGGAWVGKVWHVSAFLPRRCDDRTMGW
jgi:hypothetical protein